MFVNHIRFVGVGLILDSDAWKIPNTIEPAHSVQTFMFLLRRSSGSNHKPSIVRLNSRVRTRVCLSVSSWKVCPSWRFQRCFWNARRINSAPFVCCSSVVSPVSRSCPSCAVHHETVDAQLAVVQVSERS